MKKPTRLVRDVVKQVIDKSTGEVIDQSVEKHYTTRVKSDSYVMVYFGMLSAFYGIKSGKDKDLMICLTSYAKYDTGVVELSPSLRDEICESLGIYKSNLSASLKRLVDSGLLSGERGRYVINPAAFWKGTLNTRTEILNSEGLTFKITFVDSDSVNGLPLSGEFDDDL